MYKQFWNFLVIALAISSCLNLVDSQISAVSWIYQGTAQQNNSALTFNYYDTLNLICRASTSGVSGQLVFAVSKGTIPTGMSVSSGVITVKNVGTLIYTDLGGIQSGYENFVIYAGPYNVMLQSSLIYDFRYVSVGTLKTADSGIYSCTVGLFALSSSVTDASTDAGFFATSGRLTLTVNTKAGQAHSSRTQVNRLVTYAAAMMGASKFLF